ncbi:MAG: Na+/H+ antiporter NhaA [Bacteroidales bacterium]|nr:Na+/H+ antiporter NhaA [Bacteroidales bacterium]
MKLIPIYKWNKNVIRFNLRSDRLANQPWFQGVLLLICVIAAMLLANIPATEHLYHSILATNLQLHVFNENGGVDLLFPRDMTVEKFINDILMMIFFFTVGLEIKREVSDGELSTPKKALMPVIAAFGGVIVPALIFTIVNRGTLASGGWGIPTATDIAFAVCILSVLGDKVPISLKVFLTALAIADDLIAILVVALFYGGSVNLPILGVSLVVIMLTVVLRKVGEKRVAPYVLMAIIVWVLFYYSGIHATMSGVVMAFLIPSTARYSKVQYYHKRAQFIEKLDSLNDLDAEPFPNGPQKHYLRRLHQVAQGSMDMSYRVEHALSPWVNFVIMPIFALANAGVTIPDVSYFNIFTETIAGNPQFGYVGLGIFLGLLLGKPLGITLFSFLAVKTKVGEMPAKASWPMFFAVACLGGIGFTMSIFVDTLSFGNVTDTAILASMRDAGKIAVLLGSLSAGILGSILVNVVYRLRKTASAKQMQVA